MATPSGVLSGWRWSTPASPSPPTTWLLARGTSRLPGSATRPSPPCGRCTTPTTPVSGAEASAHLAGCQADRVAVEVLEPGGLALPAVGHRDVAVPRQSRCVERVEGDATLSQTRDLGVEHLEGQLEAHGGGRVGPGE